ncbi:MAG: hypothetical protein DMF03_07920 [Verrucomicrobia bacterium]|nr:MAG: hypothetical protein DMF03_07920 [Verrucomicrobiota bacterium]
MVIAASSVFASTMLRRSHRDFCSVIPSEVEDSLIVHQNPLRDVSTPLDMTEAEIVVARRVD